VTAPSYTYRCQVVRVIDGDTVDARIDLGFHLTAFIRIRLAGLDCPELRSGTDREAGAAARDFTATWVASRDDARPAGEPPSSAATWPFVVTTAKADAFGRWLGTLTVADDPSDLSLNAALLEAGHATPWTRR
jgi:micrococcal nuclease